MSAALDYNRSWTPEDVDGLPEDLDWRRVEIVDGLLVVSPYPTRPHLFVADALFKTLCTAAPPDLHVTGSSAPIEIGRSYRAPDAAVLTTAAMQASHWPFVPADVLLAVEVESPSSITTDRITKPAQYASAGIAHYWRVELDPLRLVSYALRDGVYVETGSWGATETAVITDPFDVTIDLTTLLP